MDAVLFPATSANEGAASCWSDGVQIDQCQPLQQFTVRTTHSTYDVVGLGSAGEVVIRGGRYFPEATHAWLSGASIGGPLKRFGIYVGCRMELRVDGRVIVTSPVCEIVPIPAANQN